MDAFWKAPPVSRTLALAAFTTSALVYSGILSGAWVVLYYSSLFKFPPQLWRLLTSFLVTGPKFGILLDPYFLFTYGSALEVNAPRLNQPGDFFVYLVFCATVILSICIPLGSVIFTPGISFPSPCFLGPKTHSVSTSSALVLAITYTYAQENRGRKVTLYFITIPIEWLPYALILLTFLLDGPPSALQQGSGLVAAHLYDFLTKIYPAFGTKDGRSYIRTPAFVRRRFAGLGGRPTGPITRSYGTAYTARSQTAQERPGPQPSRGFATGFSGLWNSRGPGRRLGE
ncbi:MAG: hypothetical protein M1815_001634 [Lichina confinis]|nr:MAG: hypothetical protein M1815_001634 [Lichina confinis]